MGSMKACREEGLANLTSLRKLCCSHSTRRISVGRPFPGFGEFGKKSGPIFSAKLRISSFTKDLFPFSCLNLCSSKPGIRRRHFILEEDKNLPFDLASLYLYNPPPRSLNVGNEQPALIQNEDDFSTVCWMAGFQSSRKN